MLKRDCCIRLCLPQRRCCKSTGPLRQPSQVLPATTWIGWHVALVYLIEVVTLDVPVEGAFLFTCTLLCALGPGWEFSPPPTTLETLGRKLVFLTTPDRMTRECAKLVSPKNREASETSETRLSIQPA